MLRLRMLSFAAALFLAVASAHAGCNNPTSTSVFYVDEAHPSASDSNPGTEASPWATIQKAASTLTAGETAYIKAGTYTGNVLPAQSGTLAAPVTFSIAPGHADHSAIIEGYVSIKGKSHVRVIGLKIQNASNGIYVEGPSTGVTLSRNYTYNNTDSGISAWGVPWNSDPGDYQNITNLIIEDNKIELGATVSNEIVTLANGVSNFEIRRNEVLNSLEGSSNGIGIDLKEGVSYGKVWGNHVHNLFKTGIYVDGGDGNGRSPVTHHIEIFNNRVHDSEEGISIVTEGSGTVNQVQVYNNLIWNNWKNGMMLFKHPTGTVPVSNISYVNNTLWNNANPQYFGVGFRVNFEDATNVTVRNNIMYANLGGDYAWTAYGAGFIEENNMTATNPLFVNAAGGDFRLANGSPAIDTGSATSAPATDFAGTARPQGAGFDMGAYER